MENVSFYFPGWVRKSLTFTIDDGNVTLDAKFRGYTEPAGFKGTFNLCTPLKALKTAEEYREFYKGYEIANHCRYHAYPFAENRPVILKDELFDPATADRSYGYRTEEKGLYRIYTYAWTYMADDEKFMDLVDDCNRELENIFGKGKVRGFIWPCGEQKNPRVFEALKDFGFRSIRKTGCVKGRTGFAMPADRMRWSYNADYTCMKEVGELYDALPDDGNLKFFCFGVHSSDFESNGCWNVLEDFCRKYGRRPGDFWYASVGDIFDYEDAVKSAMISDGLLVNSSALTLYVTVNGKRATVAPGESISVEE